MRHILDSIVDFVGSRLMRKIICWIGIALSMTHIVLTYVFHKKLPLPFYVVGLGMLIFFWMILRDIGNDEERRSQLDRDQRNK